MAFSVIQYSFQVVSRLIIFIWFIYFDCRLFWNRFCTGVTIQLLNHSARNASFVIMCWLIVADAEKDKRWMGGTSETRKGGRRRTEEGRSREEITSGEGHWWCAGQWWLMMLMISSELKLPYFTFFVYIIWLL